MQICSEQIHIWHPCRQNAPFLFYLSAPREYKAVSIKHLRDVGLLSRAQFWLLGINIRSTFDKIPSWLLRVFISLGNNACHSEFIQSTVPSNSKQPLIALPNKLSLTAKGISNAWLAAHLCCPSNAHKRNCFIFSVGCCLQNLTREIFQFGYRTLHKVLWATNHWSTSPVEALSSTKEFCS